MQARTLRDAAPDVAQAIGQAAIDSSRSDEERKLATDTVRQLGLRAIAPKNTYVLASTNSIESSELRSGVFTHYLPRGLSGEAPIRRDSNVRLAELSQLVTTSVKLPHTPLKTKLLSSHLVNTME